MSRLVWQVDPANLTPYYDAALCQALSQVGWTVQRYTSPYLYDSALPAVTHEYQTEYTYFSKLNHRRLLRYPHLRSALRTLFYLAGHRKLVRLLDVRCPDVVHMQWSRFPKLDRWLISEIRRRGIPVIHTIHDVEPLYPRAGTTDLAAVYALSDRLIVHAAANQAALVERFPKLEADRIRIIPHIAANWWSPKGANQAMARQHLGVPAQVPVVLFFGTVRSYKGLDVLIGAYPSVRYACPELWLVIAGQNKRRRALEQFRDQVIIDFDYVPFDKVWLYLLAADMAVFPYRRVTQSGALLTAMQFGLPVVATAVGALPETVDGNGWIIPPDDPTALAQAVIEAVADRSRLSEMGKRSRWLIDERHAPGLIADQTVALYEEAIRSCSVFSSAPTA